MVVDESENLGVVLIGVNNPHLREEEVDQYRICQALDNHPLLGTIHLKGTYPYKGTPLKDSTKIDRWLVRGNLKSYIRFHFLFDKSELFSGN